MPTCPHCGATIKAMRAADVEDLFGLLAVCRDAIDQDRADLARAAVHLLIQHKTQLGLRARNLARNLAEQLAERERPPGPPQT